MINRSSGENCAAVVVPRCGSVARGSPLSRSHTRTEPGTPAVAAKRPETLSANGAHPGAVRQRELRRCGARLPEPQPAVPAAADDGAVPGAHGEPRGTARVCAPAGTPGIGVKVPEPHEPRDGMCGCQRAIVGAELRVPQPARHTDRTHIVRRVVDGPDRGQPPSRRGDSPACRIERDAPHRAIVQGKRAQQFAPTARPTRCTTPSVPPLASRRPEASNAIALPAPACAWRCHRTREDDESQTMTVPSSNAAAKSPAVAATAREGAEGPGNDATSSPVVRLQIRTRPSPPAVKSRASAASSAIDLMSRPVNVDAVALASSRGVPDADRAIGSGRDDLPGVSREQREADRPSCPPSSRVIRPSSPEEHPDESILT